MLIPSKQGDLDCLCGDLQSGEYEYMVLWATALSPARYLIIFCVNTANTGHCTSV
ncbi:Uncharacterised protein [Providencia stuartii]|nr:Uncharacterised protein [Providencia stuartii]